MSMERIRNFAIIAHIDHGKSTLADRFLDLTGQVTERDKRVQYLDRMDLERERGITIKAQAIRLPYKAKDGQTYEFNLIDTPGHVDFTYEVSRSLAACDGALLVVDAAQGVEAQTVANVYLAMDNDLEIHPVLNKIDLIAADVDRVKQEIEDVVGLDASEAACISARTGLNVEQVLEDVVRVIPPPKGDPDAPLKALIFDSWYDTYLGVIVLVRLIDGRVRPGDEIRFMQTDKSYEVQSVGYYGPEIVETKELSAGGVGFINANVKDISHARVGDTITLVKNPTDKPLAGFKEVQPMVFSGLYPVDSVDYPMLRDALDKLKLNDASLVNEPETSQALGFGFRCGFLGLLHMEIVQERLEREFGLNLITTAPTVIYHVNLKSGERLDIDNPAKLPEVTNIESIEEPMIRGHIHVPSDYVGPVLQLCEERRGIQEDIGYAGENRVQINYKLPLNEIVMDFYDRLKSISKGYASLDYEFSDYQESDLIKLDVLLNGEKVDALSIISHRSRSFERGQALCIKLKEIIPRQQYEVAIQAAIGSRIIARTTVKAYRKNVTAKCYGGDISRKRKLLEKQKAGKRRMKMVGQVEIPQEAFLSVLKLED